MSAIVIGMVFFFILMAAIAVIVVAGLSALAWLFDSTSTHLPGSLRSTTIQPARAKLPRVLAEHAS